MERKTPVVLGLVFLPWLAVVLFSAGGWVALNFFVYGVLALAAGYSIISFTLPAAVRFRTIVLAPAAGVLIFSSLTAFWVRLGLPLIGAPVAWLMPTSVGALMLWRDRKSWTKCTVAHGLTLALFSALICAIYFLPTARTDMVQQPDGGFSWRFVDTQHFHSIAASIKTSGSPPKTPGTFTAELLYHFGPYAPAAAISKLNGLNLGDAVARVTRGASLWSLVLSCYGLGTLLSLKATGSTLGGIFSVAGLFFYGSPLALFADAQTSSGHVARAVLFNIPYVHVYADGSTFDHLLVGHSLLHGLVAITVILSICIAETGRDSAPSWRGAGLLVLPALVVPMQSVAALYCLAAASILLFWGHLRAARSWISIVLMVGLFVSAWHLMGYGHAPDAAQVRINEHATSQWWMLALWVIIGLGFRMVGFQWVSRFLKDPLSILVLTTVLGLLGFSLLLNLRDANERYGMYFLQALFNVFAFPYVTEGCWHRAERSKMIAMWLKLATKGMIFVCASGVLIAAFAVATHHHTGTPHFGIKLVVSFLVLLVLAAVSVRVQRSWRVGSLVSGFTMGALLVGFLAWIPAWLRYGLGEVKTGITYTAGEVRGLRRLGKLMAPDERFATNKHTLDVESLAVSNERSYGYSALSEHPVLLEGYKDRGENLLPWFKTLLRDNDLLFSTTDPEALRGVARAYHVQWLVARPGTDVALPRPLPKWLVEQQDTGALKIYRIG